MTRYSDQAGARAGWLRRISTSAALRVWTSQPGTTVDVGLEQHPRRRHRRVAGGGRRLDVLGERVGEQRPDAAMSPASVAGRTRPRSRPSCTSTPPTPARRQRRAEGTGDARGRQQRREGASEHSDLGEAGGERRRQPAAPAAAAARSPARPRGGGSASPGTARRGCGAVRTTSGSSRRRQRAIPSSPLRRLEREDALAAEDEPLDDPVERAAVERSRPARFGHMRVTWNGRGSSPAARRSAARSACQSSRSSTLSQPTQSLRMMDSGHASTRYVATAVRKILGFPAPSSRHTDPPRPAMNKPDTRLRPRRRRPALAGG